jgi:hypothetical protein
MPSTFCQSLPGYMLWEGHCRGAHANCHTADRAYRDCKKEWVRLISTLPRYGMTAYIHRLHVEKKQPSKPLVDLGSHDEFCNVLGGALANTPYDGDQGSTKTWLIQPSGWHFEPSEKPCGSVEPSPLIHVQQNCIRYTLIMAMKTDQRGVQTLVPKMLYFFARCSCITWDDKEIVLEVFHQNPSTLCSHPPSRRRVLRIPVLVDAKIANPRPIYAYLNARNSFQCPGNVHLR